MMAVVLAPVPADDTVLRLHVLKKRVPGTGVRIMYCSESGQLAETLMVSLMV